MYRVKITWIHKRLYDWEVYRGGYFLTSGYTSSMWLGRWRANRFVKRKKKESKKIKTVTYEIPENQNEKIESSFFRKLNPYRKSESGAAE